MSRLNRISLRHRRIVSRLNRISLRHRRIVSRLNRISLKKSIYVDGADRIEESEGPKTALIKRSSAIFIKGQHK